jgi:hypothetical protein
VEPGALLDDRLPAAVGLRKPVAERDAVVVRAQDDLQLRAGRVGERDRALVADDVVVAALAGGRGVGLVDALHRRALDDAQAGREVLVARLRPSGESANQLVAVAGHAPDQASVLEPRDGDRVVAVRRVDRPEVLRGRRGRHDEQDHCEKGSHRGLLYR